MPENTTVIPIPKIQTNALHKRVALEDIRATFPTPAGWRTAAASVMSTLCCYTALASGSLWCTLDDSELLGTLCCSCHAPWSCSALDLWSPSAFWSCPAWFHIGHPLPSGSVLPGSTLVIPCPLVLPGSALVLPPRPLILSCLVTLVHPPCPLVLP